MEAPVTTVPEGTANVHCKDSENRRKKNDQEIDDTGSDGRMCGSHGFRRMGG